MTCIHFSGGIVCVSPFYRLRLSDGRCVFMEWHDYLGPSVFRDKACRREYEDWYDDAMVCEAIQWFHDRGKKA